MVGNESYVYHHKSSQCPFLSSLVRYLGFGTATVPHNHSLSPISSLVSQLLIHFALIRPRETLIFRIPCIFFVLTPFPRIGLLFIENYQLQKCDLSLNSKNTKM